MELKIEIQTISGAKSLNELIEMLGAKNN